jgi:hypothetical protein
MKIRTFTAAIGAGGVLALAAAIPSQAMEVSSSHHATSSLSAQTRSRLAAQGLAEAAALKEAAMRAQTAKVLRSHGWSTEAQYYYDFGGR